MAYSGFTVQRVANQACGDTAVVEVTPDLVVEDTGGFTTLAGGVYTMKVPGDGAGLYLIGASALFASLVKLGLIEVTVTRNATETVLMEQRVGDAAGTALYGGFQTIGIARLNAGDVIKLKVSQTSGGSVNVSTGANGFTQLWAVYIGT